MGESHVLAALIRKRAELVGRIEHHQKERKRVTEDLAHLNATVKLFSPDFNLHALRAEAPPARNRFFEPGQCQRMVLDIFREAQGAALSSRQIGEALAARKGLERTTARIEPMRKNAVHVVHRRVHGGTLVAAGRDGNGAMWRVA